MLQSWNVTDLSHNTAEIHQKWINNCSLKNRRPIWSPVNPTLIDRGGYGVSNYPITFEPPKLATQECKVWIKPEWCSGLNTTNTFEPILLSIIGGKRPVGGVINPGNPKQIIYKDAVEDGVDLIYGVWDKRHPAFEKVFVFRKCPGGKYVDIDFEVKFPGCKISGLDIVSKNLDKVVSFKNPVAWYYIDGKIVKNKISIKVKSIKHESVIFTKRIPIHLIKNALKNNTYLYTDATGTYYPAVSSGGTSIDGGTYRFVSGSLQNWETFINGIGSGVVNAANTYINCAYTECSTTTDCYSYHERNFITFPTSGITSQNIVSSATLSLYYMNSTNYPSARFTVYAASLLQTNNIFTTDYSTGIIPIQLSDTIHDSTSFYNGVPAYSDLVLNYEGINRIRTTGVTQFGMSLYGDVELIAPDWVLNRVYQMQAFSADNTGTSQDPKLVVTYYPTNPKAFLMF